MSLSAEQAAVIESTDNHNLVLALPGAGKTHTMISFISNLVQQPENKVIALTFTNAAAAEMKARVGKLVQGKKRKQVFVSTFHSLIWSQTKKHPNFSGRKLLSGPSSSRVIRFIVENYRKSQNIKKEFWLDIQITHDKEGNPYDDVKVQKKKYQFITICNWLLKAFSETPFHESIEFKHTDVFTKGIDHFYQYYLSKLAELKYWPMDTMCVEITRALLQGDIEPINCTRIIVDEFQDTDLVQYSWVRCHGLAGAKITVVGDDDQSIFSFRSALGVAGMRMFQDDFEVVNHTLSMCFRCGSEILASAGGLISHNVDRIDKVMNSGAANEGEVFFLSAEEPSDEVQNIADMIQSSVGQSIAVLARTNEELNIVEAALKSDYGIDINRLNSKSIWENDNLKIIMHFCCTITQTNSHNHLVPLLVYLNESQENIVNINESLNGVSFGHCNVHDWDLSEYTIKLNQFCQQYWHLSNCTEDNQITSFIENMIGEFTPILSDGIKQFKEAFITILLGMRENSLQDKLKRIDELTNQTSKKKVENDLPILTTLHGAKGLEWDIVWLMGLDEENIPHAMPGVILTKDVVEEERRLIYVGMTRAKSNLYLSWVKSPSEFLIEAFGLEALM